MTGLSRFYARHLPSRLVWFAVTLTYASAISLLILFGRPITGDIVYIDIEVVQ